MAPYLFLFAALSVSLGSVASAQSSLPMVDLGYQIQQAISLNESSQIYNFSNIRYAQAPVGELRFKAPVAPTGRSKAVVNGSTLGRICPQALPGWSPIGEEFATSFVQGNSSNFNLTAAEAQLLAASANATAPVPDPRTSEDCLFLDVFVPKAVMNGTKKAAVLVWIYGGGYVEGAKGGSGNPTGLIQASQKAGGDGIIFVEMNYRLGAFGWMGGPSLQASGGVSNAGLYDQRLAIAWVSKYIHLFGGDPNQITIMGESAGGGSVMHQITAYGGQEPVLFQKAIPQSPGWLPISGTFQQENATQTFLALCNVSTVEEARNLSSEVVLKANYEQILNAPYGQYIYGPAVDGIFVPAQPGLLLNAGAFAHNVTVMAGHNTDEGVYFTPPNVRTDNETIAWLTATYSGIQPAVAAYIVKELYPAVYNGSYPYTDGLTRTTLIVSEAVFTCNTNYLARAYGNASYAYEYEVPPALHGFDVASTFYNGGGNDASEFLVAAVAEALQAYITDFVQTGNPSGAGVPYFPMYMKNGTEEGLNYTGIKTQLDPTDNPRCLWWQKALYN